MGTAIRAVAALALAGVVAWSRGAQAQGESHAGPAPVRESPPETGGARAPPALDAGRPAWPFAPGERADYELSLGVIHAGAARIVVGEPSGEVWPFVLLAKSEGALAVLGIRESLTSFLDAATGLPRGSVLVASEIGDRHEDRTTFDRAAGTATLQVRRKGRLEEKTLAVPGDAHDLPSAIARLRSELREPGHRVEVPVLSGAQAFVLVAEAEAREAVEVPAGRYAALRVRLRLGFSGPFSGGDVRVWLSDDARRVPLAVEAPFAIGSVRARLVAYRPGAGR
jgi:hypothetical protein